MSVMYTVDVLHNVTEVDGRHAPFARFGDEPKAQRGDQIRYVGTLEVDVETDVDACARAFYAGNADDGGWLVSLYQSWGVRSLSVGDVVVVRVTYGGRPTVYFCASQGWTHVPEGLDFFVRA